MGGSRPEVPKTHIGFFPEELTLRFDNHKRERKDRDLKGQNHKRLSQAVPHCGGPPHRWGYWDLTPPHSPPKSYERPKFTQS